MTKTLTTSAAKFLEAWGYILVDAMHRIDDDTLWQMDLAFIQDSCSEFLSYYYM
ncbi:hypothetical protein NIES2135_09040 [Leptolyngbya boryana NIES-2135]|jgi:hypothetical protein|uniref:Uncharacterized protein n=1 Tax=Leptolyngbya boryana NIES-2135 TaxID=1973484 RepID=A0A1Z4JBL6_LEPBY|nr:MULTISPECIES: hypothetical protein [Leptolyngbya]BAY54090.1 hypothetical protein NIES2135_09040 [Leptolyngbya boryana NIES-2135]MBD2369747.1 hypothetical protein [Leptolyngbya sp. FACHB-161]MBD2376052.1 hypothetical protein [Leptolyngbya sp. FACHB-238]MBD2400328.1 hypothetical protein [Leptolyngbya sp. FACHB-239]MBD2406869.1 hypothetical protein [Leptolyngbya sp. FACHB-402]